MAYNVDGNCISNGSSLPAEAGIKTQVKTQELTKERKQPAVIRRLKIFDQKCSSCHGGDLTGGMGPNLTKVGSKYSKDEILNIIKNGKGQMPANVITGDDANQVAEWLAAKKIKILGSVLFVKTERFLFAPKMRNLSGFVIL